jgi:hypothetical protein
LSHLKLGFNVEESSSGFSRSTAGSFAVPNGMEGPSSPGGQNRGHSGSVDIWSRLQLQQNLRTRGVDAFGLQMRAAKLPEDRGVLQETFIRYSFKDWRNRRCIVSLLKDLGIFPIRMYSGLRRREIGQI